MNPLQLNIDQILKETETGNRKAASQLFEYVYDELRHLANRELRREPSGITLQATALVNEVWLKLIGNYHDPKWNSRDHLLLAAANAMRRILVDAARARKRKKRGGKDQNRLALNDGLLQYAPDEELLNLNEALDELSLVDPVKADLVKLRYFTGLTNAEASRHLAISTATAERYWVFARAWLRGKMD